MNEHKAESKTWFGRNRINGAIICGAMVVVATVIWAIPAKDRTAPAQEAAPVNVTVWTVATEPNLQDGFDLPAVVEPNRVVRVSAEVQGRVVRIPRSKGSSVRSGDLLVQLDDELIRPQFEVAKAQSQRDQLEYDRMSDLVKKDAAPKRELDDASTRLAIAKANMAEVSARLDRTRVVAPIAGVLNDLPVEEGEYLQPGSPVAEVVETDPAKVAVDVPERDIAYFAVGQTAQVFVDVKGQERSLEGRMSFVSELADARTRATRVELTLPNRDQVLRSGQLVRVRLTRRIMTDAIMIPLLAVIPMEDSKAVYVVANGDRTERRTVRLGFIKGDRIQVTEGLCPGDRLIVAGHRFVSPGQKVNVVTGGK